jgi:hypothetical protein
MCDSNVCGVRTFAAYPTTSQNIDLQFIDPACSSESWLLFEMIAMAAKKI